MSNLLESLRTRKFQAHLVALGLMAVPPVLMYFAARQSAVGWVWALISLVVLGNILVLLVR